MSNAADDGFNWGVLAVQWLGSLGSVVPDKLLTGEWQLVDNSLYPQKYLTVGKHLDSTLHSMNWFPSAELLVKPSNKK